MLWLVDQAGAVTALRTSTLLELPPEMAVYALACDWCFFLDQALALARERTHTK